MAASTYPDKVVKYAREKASDEELPGLLDHLDAYYSGIKEAAIAARISLGDAPAIQGLMLLYREAYSYVQGILEERGWKLQQDAKTWTPP